MDLRLQFYVWIYLLSLQAIVSVGSTKCLKGLDCETENQPLERERRAVCSAGWTDVTGICTMNIDTPLNWWDAHLDCIQRGGYLSTKDDANVSLSATVCTSGSSLDVEGTSCYELTNTKATLQEARAYCQSKGGDVPDVANSQELQAILTKVAEQGITLPNTWTEGLWIGQHYNVDKWSYLADPTAIAFGDWASGQPSELGDNICSVVIFDDVNAPVDSYGKMYSTNCDNSVHRIMCKYSPGAWIGAAWVDDLSTVKYVNDLVLPLMYFGAELPTNMCVLEQVEGRLGSDTCDSLHPYVCREGSISSLSSSVRSSVIPRIATADLDCPIPGSTTNAFYNPNTNKCYWLTDTGSWDVTVSTCKGSVNGTIVIIESTDEANFLYTKILEKDTSSSLSLIWIGAKYTTDWVDAIDGLALTYTNWKDGLVPNSNCAVISVTDSGQWKEMMCGFPFPGLCQVDAPIITTTQQMLDETSSTNIDMGTVESRLEVTLEGIAISLIDQPITGDTVTSVLAEVTSLIMASEPLTSKSIDILLNITDMLAAVSANSQDLFEKIINIGDFILNEENKVALINEASPHTLTNFLQCMDNFASLIASTGAATDALLTKSNMDWHTAKDVKTDLNDYYFEITGNGYKSAVSIPSTVFQDNLGNIIIIVYKNLHEAASTTNMDPGEIFNSHIYSIVFALKDGRKADFTHDDISFFFSQITDPKARGQRCSFWKPDIRGWSSEGCEWDKKETDETQTVCRCNHLTNFAVLMQYGETQDLGIHEDALEYITYICISLSILCLIVTLFIYLFGKLLKFQRVIIHANLAMALLLGQVLFIGGVDATHNASICTAVALLLHYFFLAAFTWMLIEGIHLYMKSTMVFGKDVKTWIFLVLGWGLPAVIVSVTFAVRHEGYGEKDSGKCWLSKANGLTWAFIGPVLAIILINTVILGLVIRVFMTLKANADKTERERIKIGLRAILMLQPLLGLTWLFGLLGVNKHTVMFQYLFVLCNSLQGVFIFLLHCITNEEVRNIFLKRYKKMASSVQSTSSGTISSALTETTQHAIARQNKAQIEGSTNSKKAWL